MPRMETSGVEVALSTDLCSDGDKIISSTRIFELSNRRLYQFEIKGLKGEALKQVWRTALAASKTAC
jgi:hypothetical protein